MGPQIVSKEGLTPPVIMGLALSAQPLELVGAGD